MNEFSSDRKNLLKPKATSNSNSRRKSDSKQENNILEGEKIEK